MADRLRLSSLIPAGLIVERTAEVEGILVVSARATVDERACPLCRRASRRIHSLLASVHGEPRDWIASSIILGWRSADDPLPGRQNG